MSAQPDGTPVLDLITSINASSIDASSLDLDQQMLARIAALVAVDAPPASYMLNLGAAGDAGVDTEQVQHRRFAGFGRHQASLGELVGWMKPAP